MATHAQRFERIARLVAKTSVSSAAPGWDQSNREVIAELADQLDSAGFSVEILPLPGKPEKQNLIATLGRGDGGLVLAGHTDTVPYDAALWSSDPFKLSERDGKLYGLGTSDMKAFFALALEAAEGVNADALRAPLIVLATADEESTMDGARALVELQRPKGRYAIVGEPTDMVPVRAHKGIMMERIKVIGRAGHSSDPRLGNSALDGMTHVQLALLLLRAELADLYKNPGFDVPTPTLNLGRIHGGDSANRICGECELDIDVRLLPGMDPAWVRAQIEERCAKVLLDTELLFSVTSVVEGTPAHELARDSVLLQAAEQLTGAAAITVAFATEAPYLASLGSETLVLGPGGISEAHKPDEFVRADRLEPTVRVLRAMLERLCKTAQS
jgi:acetylornithine deacetylase